MNEEKVFILNKIYGLVYYNNGTVNYCAMGKLLNNLNIDCVFEADCQKCSAEHLRNEYNNVRKLE